MNWLALLILFAPQACVTMPESPVAAGSRVPDRRAVERMERGFAMHQALLTVGVQESAAMRRNARVRIRNLACVAATAGRATCTYEASLCLGEEISARRDGWCRRTAQFLPTTEVPPPLWSDRGWTLDRHLE